MSEMVKSAVMLAVWPVLIYATYRFCFWSLKSYLKREQS